MKLIDQTFFQINCSRQNAIWIKRLPLLALCLLSIRISALGDQGTKTLGTYRLEGSCAQVASDKKSDENVEYGSEFKIINPTAKMADSIRSCNAGEVKDLLKSAEIAANQREPLDKEETLWWDSAIQPSVTLEALKCSILESVSGNEALAILYTKMNATRKKGVTGNHLLSFIRVNKDHLFKTVKQFLSTETVYDNKRSVDIEHICGLDGGDRADIILKDERYAGFNYWILKPSPDLSDVASTFVEGMRGD
jgi:hypothetical protein